MQKKKITAYCATVLALGFLLPSSALAKDTKDPLATYDLGSVLVERDAIKDAAKEASQSISIITKEDIERKKAKSVEDIIFTEVGVTRTVDSMGRVGVSIRGADSRHTLILIDGQEVLGDISKYSGGDEVTRIGAENIERIEIIRGASSARFGADAVGGVVNIITKSGDENASLVLNMEGRYHNSRYSSSNETSGIPSNFFVKANSGKIGKLNLSVTASKRSLVPIYSNEKLFKKGENWYDDFKPSLRYYGNINNIGVNGEVEINDDNKLSFRINKEKEDVERRSKNVVLPLGSFFEPMQIAKRKMDRENYALRYSGNAGKTDWIVDINRGKTKQNDVALLTYYGNGHTQYDGANSLYSVDWLEHKKNGVKATFNTLANDRHYLTYGIGYSKEKAEGSRLKNAPKTKLKKINPWNYDNSLWVKDNTAGKDDKPDSYVHNYKLKKSEAGFVWDKDAEYYGNEMPAMNYEEAKAYFNCMMTGEEPSSELQSKHEIFANKLRESPGYQENVVNEKISQTENMMPVLSYYGLLSVMNFPQNKNIKFNGQYYGEEFKNRENQVLVGEAEIQKKNFFIQDSWMLDDETIITPVFRIDNSSVFGSHATANLGITHNLADNKRLKANIGTGYAEPGMGELYYNWEMYGGVGDKHLGWYWMGNPDLKPEKSFNVDMSIEGESNKTFARATIFHNEIKDYMSPYFTGQLIDFNFNGTPYSQAADRIYSFRNIGKAQITGFETEIKQKFDDNWSGKLGYTYLHAINKSDNDMPRKLLDKPTHKIDLGVNYKNDKGGIRAALWNSYYIKMLDSNSVSNDSLFKKDNDGNYVKQKGEYKEKTFGLWNLLVEKDFGKDTTAYIGVDNLFNHRDDDRAFQDRMYRVGMNMKFGSNMLGINSDVDPVALANVRSNTYGANWFIPKKVEDNLKEGEIKVLGDYRIRSNMFEGSNKPSMRATKETEGTSGAIKNNADNSGHGLEQRLRLGVTTKIGKDTKVVVVASTDKKIDSRYNVAKERGFKDLRIERAEINKNNKKWNYSIGRIQENLSTNGYWFGKEYDGAKAVYTDKKIQVTTGFGDFNKTTGITDSAYNHKEKTIIKRAPTLNELLGYYGAGTSEDWEKATSGIYVMNFDKNKKVNYREKFNAAGCIKDVTTGKWIPDSNLSSAEIAREKLAVVNELVGIFKSIDKKKIEENSNFKNTYNNLITKMDANYFYGNFGSADAKLRLSDGSVIDLMKDEALKNYGITYDNGNRLVNDPKYGGTEGLLKEKNIKVMMNDILDGMDEYCKDKGLTYEYVDSNGNKLTKEEQINEMFATFVGSEAIYYNTNSSDMTNRVLGSARGCNAISKFIKAVSEYTEFDPTERAPIPLPGAPKEFEQDGYLLVQDKIPAIDKAGYLKIKKEITDDIGVELWYLKSFGDSAQINGDNLKIANVFGIGSSLKINDYSKLTIDYGQNRSDLGRYFKNIRSNSDDNPCFGVVRADIGASDINVKGSWNAYADYKYFDHGAFLGGTGVNLPDRYLDGVRSFSVGLGYVPAKNVLLQADYTFDAKGTQKRDTFYEAEEFELGDYLRIQATYVF